MKGIRFRRNEKQELSKHVEVGEIVYAVDTNEWGLGKEDGTISWRNHFVYPNMYHKGNGAPEIGKYEEGSFYFDEENEELYRIIENGRAVLVSPMSKYDIEQTFLPKGAIPNYSDYSKVIRNDGSVEIDSNFQPSESQDVIYKKYVSDRVLFKDGSNEMNVAGSAEGLGVVTLKDFENGISVKVPYYDPKILGALWNDSGELRVSFGNNKIFLRVVSAQEPIIYFAKKNLEGTSNNGYPLNGEDAYVEVHNNGDGSWYVYSEDAVWISFYDFQGGVVDYISEINILYADVESFYYTFASITSMTVFTCIAKTGSVTDFTSAWYNCQSLTSFPEIDTSKGTAFNFAWGYCTSLTDFQTLDLSSGTNFQGAWFYCANLTALPVLDVSNGTDFSYAWSYCQKLPHCPAGNEVTIPSGAVTTDMCYECCTG